MTNEEILRDFTLLPPEGQRQVANLIAYLRQRYLNDQAQSRPQLQLRDWSEEEFVGMWRDREDMKDSVAWVRALRRGEEAK